ncbi:hypothetical protein [Massilia eburnea]|uniref:hypothetical protein n=1 Tax=Massilia eburnea TaxID=1776165 RepID=UPI003D6C5DD0
MGGNDEKGWEMKNLNIGDLIAIPSGDRIGLAKVVYTSDFFRNVLLLRLYRKTYPNLDINELPAVEELSDLYYTSSDPVTEGRWTKVGFQPISEAEKLLSKRTVGGDVWIGDEHLGPASEQELEVLPKMLTYGYRLIEKAISRFPAPESGEI